MASPFVNNNIIFGKKKKFFNQYSLNFDGVNNKIAISKSVSSPRTISMWIYPIASSDNYGALYSDEGAGGLYYAGAVNKLNYWFAGDHLSNTTLSVNNWYHIIVTINSSNAGTFYVNGVADGTFAGAPASRNYKSIGDDTATETFKGYIDEIAVFNDVFSVNDAIELYNNGKPMNALLHSKNANLVHYLHMGDGANWDGTKWIIPDVSRGGTANGTSSGMVFGDRIEIVP